MLSCLAFEVVDDRVVFVSTLHGDNLCDQLTDLHFVAQLTIYVECSEHETEAVIIDTSDDEDFLVLSLVLRRPEIALL